VCIVQYSARVSVIENEEDITRLLATYPRTIGEDVGIDFERLSHDYDALHLTHDGYQRTRSLPGLDGWDCESTLWFHWAFTNCHEVTPSFAGEEHYDKLWKELAGWSDEDYRCHRMPEDKASRHVYDIMLQDTGAP